MFDLNKPLFTAAQVAASCGIDRPVLDMMATRGQVPGYPIQITKGRRQRRMLLSADTFFKVRLMRLLSTQVGLAMAQSTEIFNIYLTWLDQMVESIENGKPLFVYAFLFRPEGQWIFEEHVGTEPVWPSGHHQPFIYIPLGDIFTDVYKECKSLLGIKERTRPGPCPGAVL